MPTTLLGQRQAWWPRLLKAAEPQAAPGGGAIRKLGYDGQPVDSSAMIAPVVVHNNTIYVAGQGANENGKKADNLDITTHVRMAMDNVKHLVEVAGGDMDHVLTLTMFLSSMSFYQAMNEAYRPYFPNRSPRRCTFSVTGIPGDSLVEISCIAEVVNA